MVEEISESVTTTRWQFSVSNPFLSLIFEELGNGVQGHFGPVNVWVIVDGRICFLGEDGYVHTSFWWGYFKRKI